MRIFVDALRSGNYEQVKGVLHKVYQDGTSGFCCLGVCTEVAIANGVIDVNLEDEDINWDDFSANSVDNGYDMEYIYIADDGWKQHTSTLLPTPVVNWLGVEDDNPFVARSIEPSTGHISNITAAELNDEYNYSFEDIAAVFEAVYLTPFESENQ